MIEVSTLTFTLISEGLVVALIAIILIMVLKIRRGNKDKKAAKVIVDQIKEGSDERQKGIQAYIQNTAKIEGDELLLASKSLDRKEKDFFTKIIRSFIRRDSQLFESLFTEFTQLIEAYTSHLATNANQNNETQEESADLSQQYKDLQEELTITKTTLEKIMAEYGHLVKQDGSSESEVPSESVANAQTVEEDDEIAVSNDEEDDTDIEKTEIVEQDLEPMPDQINQDISTDIDDLLTDDEIEVSDIDIPAAEDDVFFGPDETVTEQAEELKQPPKKDFGNIVSTDDVDDILEGIDLSEDIDEK